jgi:hypothetical protein
MQNEMNLGSVVDVGRFDLQQIGRMAQQQLMVVRVGFAGGGVEKFLQRGAGQQVDGQAAMMGSLQRSD